MSYITNTSAHPFGINTWVEDVLLRILAYTVHMQCPLFDQELYSCLGGCMMLISSQFLPLRCQLRHSERSAGSKIAISLAGH